MFLPKRSVVRAVNPSKMPSGKPLSWLPYKLRFVNAGVLRLPAGRCETFFIADICLRIRRARPNVLGKFLTPSVKSPCFSLWDVDGN